MNGYEVRFENRIETLAYIIIILAGLHFAEPILVPLAFAGILSFLLTPAANRIEKIKVNRIISTLLVSGLATIIIGGITYLLTVQLGNLAEEIPTYRQQVQKRVEGAEEFGRNILRKFSRRRDTIPPLTSSPLTLESEFHPGERPDIGKTPETPLWVKTPEEDAFTLKVIQGLVYPVLEPLTLAGLVIVLTLFFLFYREEVRDRFIRLVGYRSLLLTSDVVDDVAGRISYYLTSQVSINILYGIAVWGATALIGLPNTILWGVLATICRFIPYIGALIALALPLLVSIAVSVGWVQPGLVLGVFLALELLMANIIEPLVLGKSTGITPVGIVISALFWTWMWGTPGLILATPLTVCLVVIGKYIPAFGPMEILFADEIPFDLPSRIYYRLLSSNINSAEKLFREQTDALPLMDTMEQVFPSLLRQFSRDDQRRLMSATRKEFMREGIRTLLEVMQSRFPTPQKDSYDDRPSLLFIPAHGVVDQLLCEILTAFAHLKGLQASFCTAEQLIGEVIQAASETPKTIPVLCAVSPGKTTYIRYLMKRFRATEVSPSLLVYLGPNQEVEGEFEDFRGILSMKFTLGDALEKFTELAQ